MSKLAQIPTPSNYVEYMLDAVGYTEKVYGKSFLENSCGEGNIIVAAVNRYIQISRKEGYSYKDICSGLENDFCAYEIDRQAVEVTLNRLNAVMFENGFSNIKWNINNKDYLSAGEDKYDYIVGNPPYVTYHDLNDDQRCKLKHNFLSCQNGRFDYSYAFIEKSLGSLKRNGNLAYLVPFSIFRNEYARVLREQLRTRITRIVDLSGIQVFPDITIGTAMIFCSEKNDGTFTYSKYLDREILIQSGELGNKWMFLNNNNSRAHKLSDYCDVYNSIATLKNDVFVLEKTNEDDYYYYSDAIKIEKGIAYNAVSPRTVRLQKACFIIFPYSIDGGVIERFDEETLKKRFPKAYNYLSENKVALSNRTAAPNSRWYEYGRSQAIKTIWGTKLILPMIISGQVPVNEVRENDVPFAGYFVKCKDQEVLSLNQIKTILESEEFMDYVRQIGTPTTRSSYRLSVNDILNYTFDY